MSFMSDLGARYIDNGYAILPIMPQTKKPGLYTSGGWKDYPDWTRHCLRRTTSLELDVWRQYPGAGIGVACGAIVGVDIDVVEDAAVAMEIEQLARQRLGDTPAMRVGLAPKRLLVYRAARSFAGFKMHPIEVLARGQQFVAHAIHPETGQPYYWEGDSLADLPVDRLPEVTEEACRAFAKEAFELLPPALRPARLFGDNGNGTHTGNASLRGTYEAIDAALKWIPNPDLPYDDWRNIGMAIKGALGDAGLPLFMTWSAKSTNKDQPAYTAKTYNSFRNIRSIGAGTIYYQAQQRGWIPDPSLTLDGAVAFEIGHHPAQDLLDRAATESIEHKVAAEPRAEEEVADANIFVPDAFTQLDGIIKGFVDYAIATAPRPQPIFAVTTALCVVGVLAGRRYRSPTNLRTNLYLVDVGGSGAGKDHPRKCAVEALARAGLIRFLGGNKIASGPGLISALARQPSSLFQIDEFGKFLAQIVDKRVAKHKAEIWDNLTELFSTAASVFMGSEYSDQKERPRQTIVQPNCVLHGSTVPGPLWQALQSGALSDGSYARFLFFPTDNPVPDPNKTMRDIADVPEALLRGLKSIVAGAAGWEHGNLADTANGDPCPALVPFDHHGAALAAHLEDELLQSRRKAVGSAHEALLARMMEHVIKVAVANAVSSTPKAPVITEAMVGWAKQIVDYSTATMMRDADRFVADTDYEAKLKRVAEIIRSSGKAGIAKRDFMRRTSFVDARTLNDIITRLRDSEQIECHERPNRHGPPTVMWRWR